MSYRYASSRSSGMGGYGSYSNAYGGYGGQAGLSSQGAGTGLAPPNTASLSDDERKAPAATQENNASTPQSSADELAEGATDAHEHVKHLAADVADLRDHLEKKAHAAVPKVHEAVEKLERQIQALQAHLRKLEEQAKAHHASLTSNSASYGAPAIAAHSMGRAPSAYTSGSYSRYRY